MKFFAADFVGDYLCLYFPVLSSAAYYVILIHILVLYICILYTCNQLCKLSKNGIDYTCTSYVNYQ